MDGGFPWDAEMAVGAAVWLDIRGAGYLPVAALRSELSFKIKYLTYNSWLGQRLFSVTLAEEGGLIDWSADAVVLFSRDCPRQVFPSDPSCEPIRLRLPLSRLSLMVAAEYLANHLVRMGREAAHPAFHRPEDQARARLVADSRPSRPASMSKVTA